MEDHLSTHIHKEKRLAMIDIKERIRHPWQRGPTELIAHAIEHYHMHTEFDNRIAFLLFDVGVETLFKTYLLLPQEVTGTRSPYQKRKGAVNGVVHPVEDETRHPRRDFRFHDLIRGVLDAVPEIESKFDLTHIEFFHEKRNALYHDGNGITIETFNLQSYSIISVGLLKHLLDIDLGDILHAPDVATKLTEAQNERRQFLETHKRELMESRRRLGEVAKLALEVVSPNITKGVFIRTLRRYYQESEDKADAYFFRVVKASLAHKSVDIPLIEVGSFLQDPNCLYLQLADALFGTEDAYTAYQLSESDPTWNVSPYYEGELDDGNIVLTDKPQDEYLTEMSDWIKEWNTTVKAEIARVEMWLDKQTVLVN